MSNVCIYRFWSKPLSSWKCTTDSIFNCILFDERNAVLSLSLSLSSNTFCKSAAYERVFNKRDVTSSSNELIHFIIVHSFSSTAFGLNFFFACYFFRFFSFDFQIIKYSFQATINLIFINWSPYNVCKYVHSHKNASSYNILWNENRFFFLWSVFVLYCNVSHLCFNVSFHVIGKLFKSVNFYAFKQEMMTWEFESKQRKQNCIKLQGDHLLGSFAYSFIYAPHANVFPWINCKLLTVKLLIFCLISGLFP